MIRTRFAPSPTGYMHIGNLRTALYAYLTARINNGRFILRIEDTDTKRTVDDSVEVIFKSLELAGIYYDEGPGREGEYGPYIQSERKDIYNKFIKILLDDGKAYRCFCSKEELERDREKFSKDFPDRPFRDKCRDLSVNEIEGKLTSEDPFIVRQRIPEKGLTTIKDIVFGEITVENNTLDEQVLMKADGLPTYNFANVVDDHLMEMTHVIRGYEYLSSAPKYNLLYESFGWDIPEYIHLPHIMKDDGKKLSKRTGDASFGDLIDEGYLPEAIINYIVMLGWSPGTDQEIFTMDDLIETFNPERINRSNAVFSKDKLTWMNSQHIKRMTYRDFHRLAKKYYSEELYKKVDTEKVSLLIKGRVEKLTDIPEMIKFLTGVDKYEEEAFFHKKMKSNTESSLEYLQKVIPYFENVEKWNNDSIFLALTELINKEECKKGKVLWPVRIALTGLKTSPGGASEVGDLIGKGESLKRINDAIVFLKSKLI